MTNSANARTINQVEQETRLSKDRLRVWERRYGFPQPTRDARGVRVYPAEQVEKLVLIRRLMDAGLRPARLVEMDLAELRARCEQAAARSVPRGTRAAAVAPLLAAVQAGDAAALGRELRWVFVRSGLPALVDTASVLLAAVGASWMKNELSVAHEHLCSEQIDTELRRACADVPSGSGTPRVLLATLPGEPHALGLRMVEALLRVQAAECIVLGPQVPAEDLVAAAAGVRADIVALSFSRSFGRRNALEALGALRGLLPSTLELWVGGEAMRGVRTRIPGVVMPMTLGSVAPALERWRGARAERRGRVPLP